MLNILKNSLQEFTTAPHWMHLDIAGVSGVVDGSDVPYLSKGK